MKSGDSLQVADRVVSLVLKPCAMQTIYWLLTPRPSWTEDVSSLLCQPSLAAFQQRQNHLNPGFLDVAAQTSTVGESSQKLYSSKSVVTLEKYDFSNKDKVMV